MNNEIFSKVARLADLILQRDKHLGEKAIERVKEIRDKALKGQIKGQDMPYLQGCAYIVEVEYPIWLKDNEDVRRYFRRRRARRTKDDLERERQMLERRVGLRLP